MLFLIQAKYTLSERLGTRTALDFRVIFFNFEIFIFGIAPEFLDEMYLFHIHFVSMVWKFPLEYHVSAQKVLVLEPLDLRFPN
jgi:hypothetical protein